MSKENDNTFIALYEDFFQIILEMKQSGGSKRSLNLTHTHAWKEFLWHLLRLIDIYYI